MIPVYQDINAVQLPLVCCLCASSFIAKYYFEYDAISGDITDIAMDTQIWGGRVDTMAQKAYDYGSFYSTSITVYDLGSNTRNNYVLDLTRETFVSCTRDNDCDTGNNFVCIYE